MEVLPVDGRDLVALVAVGIGIVTLFGIHLTVVLTDLRRELRSLRRLVRRLAFLRPTGAGEPPAIDRCPVHSTSKEEQK